MLVQLRRSLSGALLLAAMFPGNRVLAQATRSLPPGTAHRMALGRIGASGVRSLLSASGGLGDLANRAGSYRLAAQLERARIAGLEGLIAGLEAALANPDLSEPERHAIRARRDRARAERDLVPAYEAAYRAATAQVEALRTAGLFRGRPLFLLARARGHARGDVSEGLGVLSEAVTLGFVWVPSNRSVVGMSLGASRTDVDIAPFEGHSGSWSLGPKINLGGVIAHGWGGSMELSHSWSQGSSKVVRPGPEDGIEVRSVGWSQNTTLKGEVLGQLRGTAPGDLELTVRPRAGAFLSTTYSPPGANSLGERSVGPFGERETVAALRVGVNVSTSIGAWGPALYLGWEQEVTRETSRLVPDRQGILVVVGVSKALGRARRVLVHYTLVRGLEGLRRVSELTVVLILDG